MIVGLTQRHIKHLHVYFFQKIPDQLIRDDD